MSRHGVEPGSQIARRRCDWLRLPFTQADRVHITQSLRAPHSWLNGTLRPSLNHKFDALILGAGAAGLMCAVEAGKRGRRVAVIEHAARPGKKIVVAGRGRDKVNIIYCPPKHFITAKQRLAKYALVRYKPAYFVALVEKHHIP